MFFVRNVNKSSFLKIIRFFGSPLVAVLFVLMGFGKHDCTGGGDDDDRCNIDNDDGGDGALGLRVSEPNCNLPIDSGDKEEEGGGGGGGGGEDDDDEDNEDDGKLFRKLSMMKLIFQRTMRRLPCH